MCCPCAYHSPFVEQASRTLISKPIKEEPGDEADQGERNYCNDNPKQKTHGSPFLMGNGKVKTKEHC